MSMNSQLPWTLIESKNDLPPIGEVVIALIEIDSVLQDMYPMVRMVRLENTGLSEDVGPTIQWALVDYDIDTEEPYLQQYWTVRAWRKRYD